MVKMESEECVSAIREKLEPLEGMHTFLYLEAILDFFSYVVSSIIGKLNICSYFKLVFIKQQST